MLQGSSVRRLGAVFLGFVLVVAMEIANPPSGQAQNHVGFHPIGLKHAAQSNPTLDYDYNASVMQDGGVIKAWWCGGQQSQNGTDQIYYATYDAKTNANIVAPLRVFGTDKGSSVWDANFVCNPSVVKGLFTPTDPYLHGIGTGSFNYAMYFTGTKYYTPGHATPTAPNRIGVAFSVDGVNWYANPTPLALAPVPTPTSGCNPQKNWSLFEQFPSAVSIDGAHRVRLFYMDFCHYQYQTTTSADGVNFAAPTPIDLAGIQPNVNPALGSVVPWASFSYDTVRQQWIASVCMGSARGPTHREGTDTGFHVMTVPGTGPGDAPTGRWSLLHDVDLSTSGHETNSYPTTLHNAYGWLDNSVQNYSQGLLTTFYTYTTPQFPMNVSTANAAPLTSHQYWDIGGIWLPLDRATKTPLVRYTYSNTNVTTTGVAPTGYSHANPAPQTVGQLYESEQPSGVAHPLYNCQIDGTYYYFVTASTACGGTNRYIGLLGFALDSAQPGSVPLSSCRVRTTYYYVSSSGCGANAFVEPLGYSVPG